MPLSYFILGISVKSERSSFDCLVAVNLIWKTYNLMNTESVRSIIKLAPNNPEKIFTLLGLPITYIDDVELVKNGKNRVFKYKERDLFSPEIVAVVHYENQGHIASWNEGLAFSMVRDAFKRALTCNLFDQLEYVGLKNEALLISPSYDTNNNRAITRAEQLLTKDKNYLERNRPKQDSIENSHLMEKECLGKRDNFPIGIQRFLNKQVEWIRFLLDAQVSIKCKCEPEDLMALFMENVDKARIDKGHLLSELRLPNKTGDRTDAQQRFANEWTMKFAKQMINECSFDYLLRELFRFSRLSPRWDLTVIDGVSKKLRYIEVKLDDNFTEFQLNELPAHLEDGGTLELCKIRPRKIT